MKSRIQACFYDVERTLKYVTKKSGRSDDDSAKIYGAKNNVCNLGDICL